MLNSKTVHPLESQQLLAELIFSYLNLKDLYSAGLVSHLWQGSFNDPVIWRHLIDQHFPYLPEKSVEAYRKDPKTLFIAELKHIDVWINAETNVEDILALKKHLLTALRGGIETIEQLSISSRAKEFLYTYAAANNHKSAINKLNTEKKRAVLTIKAKNFYTPAKRMTTNSMSYYCLMIEAAAIGDVETLRELLAQENPLAETSKNEALKVAAEYGQLEVVRVLVTEANPSISNDHKDDALWVAAMFGHVPVVQFLLPAPMLRTSAKIHALKAAAQHGELNVVKALLTQVGAEFSFAKLLKAFSLAAKFDQANVVQFFLTEKGRAIPINTKIEALLSATNRKMYHAALVLSRDISSWGPVPENLSLARKLERQLFHGDLSDQDKGITLVESAKNGFLPLVEALLEEHENEISIHSKLEALVEANNHGHTEIERVLSRDVLSLYPKSMTVAYSGKRKESAETTEKPVRQQKSAKVEELKDHKASDKRAKF